MLFQLSELYAVLSTYRLAFAPNLSVSIETYYESRITTSLGHRYLSAACSIAQA